MNDKLVYGVKVRVFWDDAGWLEKKNIDCSFDNYRSFYSPLPLSKNTIS